MAITPAMVKELRERTGVGMMDCKKALEESGGDIEAAIDKLRKDSGLKAAKKAGRTAAEGLLGLQTADDASAAVLAEVNIETDFAARNENFVAFVQKVAATALAQETDDVAALLDGGLEAEREALVQGIGENVTLRRVARLTGPVVGSYLHADSRKGALVALDGGNEELARDLAMHVVAIAPQVVSADDLDPATLAREQGIFEAQAAESGKPAEIVAKMVEGRLKKFKAEVSLLEQPFVKDGEKRVGQLLDEAGVRCLGFVRLEVGEGIEKEDTDFAAEVAQARGQG